MRKSRTVVFYSSTSESLRNEKDGELGQTTGIVLCAELDCDQATHTRV